MIANRKTNHIKIVDFGISGGTSNINVERLNMGSLK